MSQSASPAPARAGRTVALIAALSLGGVLLVFSILGAIPLILSFFSDYWNGRADIITPRVPFIDSWAELTKDSGDAYAGVLISSAEPLVMPRILQATAAALGSLTIMVGSLLVVLLAVRMLRGRSFTRLLRWGLAILGLLVMVAAAVAPQLEALAVDLAVQDLGYPIYNPASDGVMVENSPEYIPLNLWDGLWVLDRVDIVMFLLGIVIAAFAALVAEGERLQRDTDGLV